MGRQMHLPFQDSSGGSVTEPMADVSLKPSLTKLMIECPKLHWQFPSSHCGNLESVPRLDDGVGLTRVQREPVTLESIGEMALSAH